MTILGDLYLEGLTVCFQRVLSYNQCLTVCSLRSANVIHRLTIVFWATVMNEHRQINNLIS